MACLREEESCRVQANYVILHYVILHNRLNYQEMKLLSNPFVIGKYVEKDYFCDRERRNQKCLSITL